jgi:hypothetical protein
LASFKGFLYKPQAIHVERVEAAFYCTQLKGIDIYMQLFPDAKISFDNA